MVIQAFHKYIVLCQKGQQLYRWHLDVTPWNNAWKILNEKIEVGSIFKGHFILSIEEIEGQKSFNEKLAINDEDDLEFWEHPISEEEFDCAVQESGIGFAVSPSYGQTFRCQICGGVVANDICTECMFDWDS